MPEDYAYLNARIRCRRSRLLHDGFFGEALSLSLPELVKVLSESVYGPDLTGSSLADVDRAVRAHFNRTVGDLPRLVSGTVREAVTLILLRADLANVKTILRGRAIGRPPAEIMDQLGEGTLPQGLYQTMVEAGDAASLGQVLALSKHPLTRALREASRAGGEPLEVEVNLDRTFYTAVFIRARRLDQPYLARFFGFELDTLNLSVGLRLFALGVEGRPERFFLEGGGVVSLALFQRLARGDVAGLEELEGTDLGRVSEAEDLQELERGLRCALLAKAHECSKDVLGAGLALDYIQRKRWEAGRIRLLARRALYDLPRASVEKEMVCE